MGDFKIFFFKVGNGHCSYLEFSNGKKAKIERTLKCFKCGYEKVEVKWEDLE